MCAWYSADIVDTLTRIFASCVEGDLTAIEAKSDLSFVIEAFFRSDPGSEFSQSVMKHRQYMTSRNSFSVKANNVSKTHIQMTDMSSPNSSVATRSPAAVDMVQTQAQSQADSDDVVSMEEGHGTTTPIGTVEGKEEDGNDTSSAMVGIGCDRDTDNSLYLPHDSLEEEEGWSAANHQDIEVGTNTSLAGSVFAGGGCRHLSSEAPTLYTVDLPSNEASFSEASANPALTSSTAAGTATQGAGARKTKRPSNTSSVTTRGTSSSTGATGKHSESRFSSSSGAAFHPSALELQTIHERIALSSPWKLIDEMAESVVVLSGSNTPHIMLKASMTFLSIVGLSSEQLFGRCLEDLMAADLRHTLLPDIDSTGILSGESSQVDAEEEEDSNGREAMEPLIKFYTSLDRGLPSSCVLKLTVGHGRRIAFSVHSFPILRRTADPGGSQESKYGSTGRSPMFFFQHSESSRKQGSDAMGDVAFHVVYLNNFNRDRDGSAELDSAFVVRSPIVSLDLMGPGSSAAGAGTLGSDDLSILTPNYDGSSVKSNATEKLRGQGLANDL
jgi:hypothetical protein